MNPKSKRGGSRRGAGRKPGSGVGRTVTTLSLSLEKAEAAELDRRRGAMPRGKYIAAALKL